MNGKALSAMEMRKKSKLLKTAYATALSFTSFSAVLSWVVAYARTFNEAYEVQFGEDRGFAGIECYKDSTSRRLSHYKTTTLEWLVCIWPVLYFCR